MVTGCFKVLWCSETFSKSSEERRYNDLPDDILDKIMNELDLISDFIRFGGVCKCCYRVFSRRKRYRIEWYNNEAPLLYIPPPDKLTHTPPSHDIVDIPRWSKVLKVLSASYGWLATIIPPALKYTITPPKHLSPSQNDIVTLPNQLFHVLENKCYDSKSPVDIPPHGSGWYVWKILSASYGWLATIIKNKEHFIISLKNPVTGNTISLPPILVNENWGIIFVVLSCDPAIYPDKCVVAYQSIEHIAFIRVCGKTWNIFSPLTKRMISSIRFHRGKWYVLMARLELIVIDCFWERNDPNKCAFKSCKICKDISNFEGDMSVFRGSFGQEDLVENECGELLAIRCGRSFRVSDLVMCKLVLTQDKGIKNMKGHWVRIHKLGNGVLFLNSCGKNAMCSMSTNLHPGSVYIFNPYSADRSKDDFDVRRIIRLNRRMQQVGCIRLSGAGKNAFVSTFSEPLWIKQVSRQEEE